MGYCTYSNSAFSAETLHAFISSLLPPPPHPSKSFNHDHIPICPFSLHTLSGFFLFISVSFLFLPLFLLFHSTQTIPCINIYYIFNTINPITGYAQRDGRKSEVESFFSSYLFYYLSLNNTLSSVGGYIMANLKLGNYYCVLQHTHYNWRRGKTVGVYIQYIFWFISVTHKGCRAEQALASPAAAQNGRVRVHTPDEVLIVASASECICSYSFMCTELMHTYMCSLCHYSHILFLLETQHD